MKFFRYGADAQSRTKIFEHVLNFSRITPKPKVHGVVSAPRFQTRFALEAPMFTAMDRYVTSRLLLKESARRIRTQLVSN